MWEPDYSPDGRDVEAQPSPAHGAGTAAATNEQTRPSHQRPRSGWTTSDERAWEHQQLALALEQSENEALRIRKENAARGSTVDADYLFALSLAQQVNGPRPAAQQGPQQAARQPTRAGPTASEAVAHQAATQVVASGTASAASALTSQPAAAGTGKKKGLLRSLSKSLRKRSSKSSTAPSVASDDSASTLAGSVSGQPDDQWQAPVAHPPAQPGPLSRHSPLGHPGAVQQTSQPSTDAHRQDEQDSAEQQQPSGGHWVRQGQYSPMSASPASSTPVGVSPSESHDDEAVRPLSTGTPLRWPPDNSVLPAGSPVTEAASSEEAINESGYRELLLDTQMLRQDLEKTLADKQHTMRRLDARGVELQADMHSVRHRIDDPAGWEAFSLYSQQQADLEGRLRLGKRQEDLLQSCMKQLQDLQTFVYARRPHAQDVVQLQDATFSELLRRLQRLDVDPQLPGDVAVAAAPDGDAEDAASQIRAVCQSSADIDFAAALNIACSHRTAKEKQEADGDLVQQAEDQEAVPAALQESPADDGQEEWQSPSAGGSQRASWVTGYRADDLDEADAELDDLPETDYMVPHVAGPFSFQGRHAATPSNQSPQPESSPVPPMSESQSPMSASDQDEWVAADAAAEPMAIGSGGPSGMSKDSSYDEYWTPVYGAAVAAQAAALPTDTDALPSTTDSVVCASSGKAAAAGLGQDTSDAPVQPQAASGALTAADMVTPDADVPPEDTPAPDAVDAELEARLAALSHRPSAASRTAVGASATVAEAAPADASTGGDLAQVLREAEARFLASGDAAQQEGPGAAAAGAMPSHEQAEPQQVHQLPAVPDMADGGLLGEQSAAGGVEAAQAHATPAEATELSAVAEDVATMAELVSEAPGAAPKPAVPGRQAAEEAATADADAAASQPLPADAQAAAAAPVVSPALDEVQMDQHSAAEQQSVDSGSTARECITITLPSEQIPPLQRQEGGSGSFSFPAPSAIAAAAVGTSPRAPPAVSEDADTHDAPTEQSVHQLSREGVEQDASSGSSMAETGDVEVAAAEVLEAAATSATAEQPVHHLSRDEPQQATPSADSTAAAGEQAVPQSDAHVQTAPGAVPAVVAGAETAESPTAHSLASNGSYDRAAERRRREERQAALEAQRQALAERRKLRSQSGGSSMEAIPVPEPPVVQPRDAKARVRFAVEEGEAPGDRLPDPEATRVSPRSALKQTAQVSHRASPHGSVQRTSPPSARPPAGMRTRGSQEQLAAMVKADTIRRQLQDPVDIKRMTRIEKQFALMELQYLLGDHRASDRRQADALDQRPRGAERAGSSDDLARLPEAERSRVREQRRRERDRERSRAGGSSGGATTPGRRASSDGASVSGSDAGSGSVSASSAGRSPEGRITRRSSIPTMPGNAGLRTVSIPSGSPGSGGLRGASSLHANGSGSLDGAPRSSRRSSSRDASDAGGAPVPAASLSEEQLQALALEYKNLALEIRDFEALDLQDAATMLQRIQASTKGKPSPAAVGIRGWPTRKVTALQEVVADWNELQHLSTALKQWRMLPDFSCLDEGTRIETYLNVVKQTTNKMAVSSAETQQRFTTAGVPWSPNLLQGVRRAATQPAKLYLERVLREAGSLGNSQSARANGLTLTRSALRLGVQVQQFTGSLDRDVSVLLKRVQNLQATIRP